MFVYAPTKLVYSTLVRGQSLYFAYQGLSICTDIESAGGKVVFVDQFSSSEAGVCQFYVGACYKSRLLYSLYDVDVGAALDWRVRKKHMHSPRYKLRNFNIALVRHNNGKAKSSKYLWPSGMAKR